MDGVNDRCSSFPSNFWFSIALIAVFIVFVLELIGTIFGASVLGVGDDFGELDSEGFLNTAFANFLNINKVPFLIYLIVLLTVFGLSGLLINGLSATVLSVTPLHSSQCHLHFY